MPRILYAWRVLRSDGSPSSIIVTLSDAQDASVVAAVHEAARANDVQLEPLPLDDLHVAAHVQLPGPSLEAAEIDDGG